MPLLGILIVAGVFASVVLGFIVGAGWAAIRYGVYCADDTPAYTYNGERDFGSAWMLTFLAGIAMTVVGIGIAWKMGVDMLGGLSVPVA